MNEAIQILGERLAKGEITPEEFKTRLAVLTEGAKELGAAPPNGPSTSGSDTRKIADAGVQRYFDRSAPITLGKTAKIAAAFGAAAEAAVVLIYAILKLVLVDSLDAVDNYDYYRLGILILVVVAPALSVALAILLLRRPCEGGSKPVRFGIAFAAALVAAFVAYLIVASILSPILHY